MKKVFSNESIRAIDVETLRLENIPSIKLMERAAKSFTDSFTPLIARNNSIMVICGPGNNGGDGLAIARILTELNFQVKVIYVRSENYSGDFLLQLDKIKRSGIPYVELFALNYEIKHLIQTSDIIVDALFGSGLNRIPSGIYSSLISFVNDCNKIVVSVDVPSGISESFLPNSIHTIKASATITFELTKLMCLFEENIPFIGELITVDIGLSEKAISEQNTSIYSLETIDAHKLLNPKKSYFNKWHNGHAVIIAGSEDKAGAALLATESCLHSGCGMLSAIIPSGLKTAFNVRLPEVMLHTDLHQQIITHIPLLPYADAYGIGCGIGTSDLTQQAVLQFLYTCNKHVVIDADAINILAIHKNFTVPKQSILTPHFKEFDRLTKSHVTHAERLTTLKEFCVKHQCTVVLKATHSCICDHDGNMFYCMHPDASLGKAGSGDVLTGIITSFLAQGYESLPACIIALQLMMLSAKSVSKNYTAYSSSSSLLIEALPKSFKKLLA